MNGLGPYAFSVDLGDIRLYSGSSLAWGRRGSHPHGPCASGKGGPPASKAGASASFATAPSERVSRVEGGESFRGICRPHFRPPGQPRFSTSSLILQKMPSGMKKRPSLEAPNLIGFR